MFSREDIILIKEKGLSSEQITSQIQRFKDGFPYLNIIRPAVKGDGIQRVTDADDVIEFFDTRIHDHSMIRFVPASGAASRMFKALFAFVQKPGTLDEHPAVREIIENIDKLAFKPGLQNVLSQQGASIHSLITDKKYDKLILGILEKKGLDYGDFPKALLPFHCYPNRNRSALEEHLVEGALYNKNSRGEVHIYFTISPEHEPGFVKLLAEVQKDYEKEFNVSYVINFSYQKPSTDTIAVELNNEPFRNEEGKLIFRPGGHGALLENLNDLDADVIFIKNIDNVAPDRLKTHTVRYKKLLGGILLQYKEKIYTYLKKLDEDAGNESLCDEISRFLKNELHVQSPLFERLDPASKRAFFFSKLNRPLRVCGMVPNQGEPGGGPFFAVSPDGSTELQIVESSQINHSREETKKLVSQATHFNPVDLVCAVRDYRGVKFDLRLFRDENTGFISTKSSEGRTLKALEWPGLWNGAMSDWNTVFVEVPIETFNPVKTINDLLRPQHQQDLNKPV